MFYTGCPILRARPSGFPWLWIALISCLLVSFGLAGAELASGPFVEEITSTNAVLRWETDVATGSRVQYWTNAVNIAEKRVEGDVRIAHRVSLSGLKSGTRYYFTVGTARRALTTNSFTTLRNSESADPSRITGATTDPAVDKSAASKASVLGVSKNSTRPDSAQAKSESARKAPPTKETWGNVASLQDHFDRHGGDFKAKSQDDYARMAWEFLQRASAESLPMKLDEEGVLRVYDPKTRAFAAYNRNGTTKTFFKPQSRDYFDRQPGRAVKPQELKFR